MKYISISDFIKEHLRFKQHWNKKRIDMGDAQFQVLDDDTFIGDCTYAKGSIFKVFETTNFGWIVFKSDTKTPEGHRPNKLILKW